jgi:hypothetical protein
MARETASHPLDGGCFDRDRCPGESSLPVPGESTSRVLAVDRLGDVGTAVVDLAAAAADIC